MHSSGATTKPTVFLSHAATDQPIVQVLHDEIKRVFANGVDVFASSVPGELAAGDPWLDRINEKLRVARAVIVLITPVSLNRPWIWFEVGASWSRMEDGQGRILPVCVPEIDKGASPEPLSRLHAKSMGKAGETKAVFEALVDLFGFGELKGFKYATIKAKLPRYDELRVADSDLRSGAVYTGPYEGYSDKELIEVLDDRLLKPAWNDIEEFYGRDEFKGGLLHFRGIDESTNSHLERQLGFCRTQQQVAITSRSGFRLPTRSASNWIDRPWNTNDCSGRSSGYRARKAEYDLLMEHEDGRVSPGPCVRCGTQGPWDDMSPGAQYGPRLEERESHWFFEPKNDDPDGFLDYDRPVCPDCTTWDDRWEQSKSAREMIEESRANGRQLSENENMWLGEIAEIVAHRKLDAEDRARLFGED